MHGIFFYKNIYDIYDIYNSQAEVSSSQRHSSISTVPSHLWMRLVIALLAPTAAQWSERPTGLFEEATVRHLPTVSRTYSIFTCGKRREWQRSVVQWCWRRVW